MSLCLPWHECIQNRDALISPACQVRKADVGQLTKSNLAEEILCIPMILTVTHSLQVEELKKRKGKLASEVPADLSPEVKKVTIALPFPAFLSDSDRCNMLDSER